MRLLLSIVALALAAAPVLAQDEAPPDEGADPPCAFQSPGTTSESTIPGRGGDPTYTTERPEDCPQGPLAEEAPAEAVGPSFPAAALAATLAIAAFVVVALVVANRRVRDRWRRR